MQDRAQQEKFRRLTEEPVEKLVRELSVPTIISMLITAFYNMADTFFVGRINNSATGAVGVAFSLMAIIQACGFFFGHGSGNYISRQLGLQNGEEASKMAATGFFSSFFAGILITVFGLIFLDPLARLLGSTDTILPYAKDYMRYILIAAPFMTSSLVLNNQLRFQGSPYFGMIGITCGALLNVILDPIFIFGFDFGVSGAAIATVVSQIVGFFILLAMSFRGGNIRISFRLFRPSVAHFKEILLIGGPSFLRQGLASLSTLSLNFMAGGYGDAAVAAMSVVGRIMFFVVAALIGYGQGFQPVCGFNFGAGRYDRIIRAFWYCVWTSFIVLVVISVGGFIGAPWLMSVFRDDPEVISIGYKALRWQFITFPLSSWIVLSNMMTQTLRMPIRAMFLSIARQGLFFIPLVLILPRFWGLAGIQIAQPIADIFTFICSIPMQLSALKMLKKEQKKI